MGKLSEDIIEKYEELVKEQYKYGYIGICHLKEEYKVFFGYSKDLDKYCLYYKDTLENKDVLYYDENPNSRNNLYISRFVKIAHKEYKNERSARNRFSLWE